MMTYSAKGLQLTEKFEADGGPKLTAYQDVKGVWTIGYGHTGPDVHPGLTWTPEQCEAALQADIHWACNVVNNLVTIALTQGEFDALVDFVFNIGAHAFATSTLLDSLNKHLLVKAAAQFDEWDHAGGKVVSGLLRRRMAETVEFQS